MTVVLRYNEALELNLVDYVGAVTLAQLKAIAAYGAKHPHFLKQDTFNLVHADADFSAVDLAALDALFARYRKLYAPLDFQIYRRSAWVCRNPAAEPHVAYWLGERDFRTAFSANVRRFESVAEACDWLLLSETERGQVERSEGFVELDVFDDTPEPAFAR